MRAAMLATQANSEREKERFRRHLQPKEDSRSDSGSSDTDVIDLSPEDVAELTEWSVNLDGSIYDSSVLMPLMKSQTASPAGFVFGLLGSLLLLLLNGILQFFVLAKVSELTEIQNSATQAKLFSLCKMRNTSFPFAKRLDDQPADGVYWDCGPLTATLLAGVPALVNFDIDGDGAWSKSDAETQLEIDNQYGKESQTTLVLRHFLDRARQEKLDSQRHLTSAESVEATKNFTQLPISWLENERFNIELCVSSDPYLCGNLEARGILEGHNFGDTSNARIRQCEHVMNDFCPELFGQYYDVYKAWSYELCGDRTTIWLDEERIIASSYGLVRAYSTLRDAIVSPLYASFLLVMLGIWWMSMLVEMREILNWWVVMLWYPLSDADGTAPVVVHHDGRVQVNAIPAPYKAMTIIANLVPRTILCAWLTYVGSLFLISADDYENLILNGVALAFLIEVDNMLFAAVVSSEAKRAVYECTPLKVSVPHWISCLRWVRTVSQTSLYTIFLVSLNLALLFQAYYGDQGKFEVADSLRCLCQAEGPKCVTAQMLGGTPWLQT